MVQFDSLIPYGIPERVGDFGNFQIFPMYQQDVQVTVWVKLPSPLTTNGEERQAFSAITDVPGKYVDYPAVYCCCIRSAPGHASSGSIK